MQQVLLILLVIFTFPIFAFNITTIDETQEALDKAKNNEIAADGKTIFKPIEVLILKPTSVPVLDGNNLIVRPQKIEVIKPMKTAVIKPMKTPIIYPIGETPKIIKKEHENITKMPEDIFISKDDFENNKASKKITIEVDTDFKKSSEDTLDKSKIIAPEPVNIE